MKSGKLFTSGGTIGVELKAVPSDKFWCCFVAGTGGFHHRHATRGEAEQEAERLARLNEGTKVYVLETITHCIAEPAFVTFYSL